MNSQLCFGKAGIRIPSIILFFFFFLTIITQRFRMLQNVLLKLNGTPQRSEVRYAVIMTDENE